MLKLTCDPNVFAQPSNMPCMSPADIGLENGLHCEPHWGPSIYDVWGEGPGKADVVLGRLRENAYKRGVGVTKSENLAKVIYGRPLGFFSETISLSPILLLHSIQPCPHSLSHLKVKLSIFSRLSVHPELGDPLKHLQVTPQIVNRVIV